MTLTRAFIAGLVSGIGFILGQSLIVVLVARWNARLAAKAARKAAEARAATDRALQVAAQKRAELAGKQLQVEFKADSFPVFATIHGGPHAC